MAQRLAHFVHTEGVVGSIPTSPTRDSRSLAMWPRAFFHNRRIPIIPETDSFLCIVTFCICDALNKRMIVCGALPEKRNIDGIMTDGNICTIANELFNICRVQSECRLECRGAGRMAGFRRCNLWLRANMQPEDGGAELVCRGIVRASAEYVMMSITYEGTLR